MPGLPYPESSDFIATARDGLSELFGGDTVTTQLLLGRIIGNATLDGLGVVDLSGVDPEAYGYDLPPRYAERAIKTNDPAALAELIGEAADRLSRCVPANNVSRDPEQAERGGFDVYARRMMGNGTDEDKPLGSLRIHLSPPKDPEGLVERGHHLAKLEYVPGYSGKEWPVEAELPTGAQIHRLSIFQRLLTDPLTKNGIVSTNVHTGYNVFVQGNARSFHSGFGIVSPIDAKIKATMFYYLDHAITYYESLQARPEDTEYPGWIDVEEEYKTKIHEYLSRLQDIIDHESGGSSTTASKQMASMP